ncbi:sensor histidine kinase [Arthrobacter agilis]|uniref:sensor histidine kinase n=1 Tax=Arthrobacter agilis TaxID=37921 RepID=UPI000B34E70F|nr:histidine kinase [Arthrobacter agilis]OUM40395.1 sensor histidine kinase [Arthrobacter agilis]PPB45010.1 sensor histidine kinase [Arthrobacter agilis]TPV27713.1 sensor histidine kinase [Arthrobacter agilis]VDR31646.1 Inner membrane protein ypdA [Arthrobacter agilis]
MFSAAVDTALVCAVAVITLAVVASLGFRFSRSYRDLGSDADRATYATLHTAALASEHLREGLTPTGAARASRHLRGLLRCDILMMSDTDAVLAWDSGRGVPPEVMPLVRQVLESGRTQIFRRQKLEAADLTDLGELVLSPVRADDRVVGTVGAFAGDVNAGLVRATNELAGWVSTQVELAELGSSRRLLAEAEVRALRAQISPHFIYNSLNAIASFINTDPQRARELVVEFADFTRYSFRRHGDFTTVAEELRSVDRYLLLERARFGDRLKVTLEIGPEVLSTVIPFLSLQPLVENAVRHGLDSRDGRGHITITAHDAGAFAEVTVEDDGVGIDPEHLRSVLAGHTEDVHVGLRNVDLRLRQVYGDDHGLVIDTAPGAGTLITLRVPKSQPDHQA